MAMEGWLSGQGSGRRTEVVDNPGGHKPVSAIREVEIVDEDNLAVKVRVAWLASPDRAFPKAVKQGGVVKEFAETSRHHEYSISKLPVERESPVGLVVVRGAVVKAAEWLKDRNETTTCCLCHGLHQS